MCSLLLLPHQMATLIAREKRRRFTGCTLISFVRYCLVIYVMVFFSSMVLYSMVLWILSGVAARVAREWDIAVTSKDHVLWLDFIFCVVTRRLCWCMRWIYSMMLWWLPVLLYHSRVSLKTKPWYSEHTTSFRSPFCFIMFPA